MEFAVAPEGSADWPVFPDGRLRPAVQSFGLCNGIQSWSADCATMAFCQPGNCYFAVSRRGGKRQGRTSLLGICSQTGAGMPSVTDPSLGTGDIARLEDDLPFSALLVMKRFCDGFCPLQSLKLRLLS